MIALGVPASYFRKLYTDQIEDIFSLSSSAERAIEILQRELSYKDEEDKVERTLTQNLLACLLANNFKDPQVFSSHASSNLLGPKDNISFTKANVRVSSR